MGAAPGSGRRGGSRPTLKDRLTGPAIVLLVLALIAGGVVAYDELTSVGDTTGARVTFVDGSGAGLGTVDVTVADTFRERYTGLSDTESLGPNEGMLFIHEDEGTRAYVMRDMSFPIDIVFVDADRRITTIHHAEVEEPPLTQYQGRAKWVVEVPYNWTVDHGVSVGDRIRIDGVD